MSVSSLTIAVDLRSKFGPARDQGPRPTCMAFAASDGHTFVTDCETLSTEYAFYHAVARTVNKDRSRGVSFTNMSDAIAIDGQPIESGWPYDRNLSLTGPWSPPSNSGNLYRRNSKKITCDLDSIRTKIEEGHPVIVITDISRSFYKPLAGEIINAAESEPRAGTHAVLAVGVGDIGTEVSFLIRNSWGVKWGVGGYAWLHGEYLKPRLRIAGIFT